MLEISPLDKRLVVYVIGSCGTAPVANELRDYMVPATYTVLAGLPLTPSESGGHSLLATRVVSTLRQLTGAELSLLHFFENPTVEGIAERLLEQQLGNLGEEELAQVLRGM